MACVDREDLEGPVGLPAAMPGTVVLDSLSPSPRDSCDHGGVSLSGLGLPCGSGPLVRPRPLWHGCL